MIQREFVWLKYFNDPKNQPLGKRYHNAVYLDGKMYVFGGVGVSKKPDNILSCFNFDSKQWETNVPQGGEIPCPRYGHTCQLFNRKMYIHGGNEFLITPICDFFCYDFDKKHWEKLEVSGGPSARYYHSSDIHNGKLYLFGGCENKRVFHNDLYCYDLESNHWKKIDLSPDHPLPLPRAGHIIFVIKNRLYLFGGFGDAGGYTYRDDMFYLDLEKMDHWVPVELHEGSTTPKSGRCLSGVTLNDKHYVFGGYDGKVPQRTLHCFEPELNLWSVITLALSVPDDMKTLPMSSSQWYDPTPRYGHSTIIDDKKNMVIYSGSGSMFLGDIMMIDTDV